MSFLRRHDLEIVPGDVYQVQEMPAAEAEDLAVIELEVEEAPPRERLGVLAEAYAGVALRHLFRGEDLVFKGKDAAYVKGQLNYRALQAIAALALGTDDLAQQVARFRGSPGPDAGVEAVPDGPDVRVPAARAGEGAGV